MGLIVDHKQLKNMPIKYKEHTLKGGEEEHR
jgi:hypothetical protein